MSLLRPGVLLCAALISSPALYQAFVDSTLEADTALLRFLIAVPLCAVARGVLVALTAAPQVQTAQGELVEGVGERRGAGTA